MSSIVDNMSVRELRATIADGGLSSVGVVDKAELRRLAAQALQLLCRRLLKVRPTPHEAA